MLRRLPGTCGFCLVGDGPSRGWERHLGAGWTCSSRVAGETESFRVAVGRVHIFGRLSGPLPVV